MSRITLGSFKCPTCRAPLSVEVYQSVNVALDPTLKDRVLSKKINCVKCTNCGQEIALGSNLLYNDPKKQIMLWLRQDQARDGEMPMSGFTLRIVHTYEALIEKILIFDNGFDDVLFEGLKLLIWDDASGKKQEEYRGDEVRFTGIRSTPQDDLLLFEIYTRESMANYTIRKSELIKLQPLPEIIKAKARVPTGTWHVVDKKFIVSCF